MRVAGWAAAIAAVCAALTLGRAQTSAGSNSGLTGRQVIDKTVAALGGDHFLQMHTRTAAGRIYGFFHDQISGADLVKSYASYLLTAPAGGLAVQERQLLGKKLDYSNLFTPTKAYDITFRGARPYTNDDWQRYVRTTRNDILYILRCRLKEPGLQIDYIGSDIYLSRHVEIVEITDATDQVVRVYLDHNTMLPMHESYAWFDEKTREHNDAAVDYDKYRDAGGGVMWPFVIERERNGYKVFQMFANTIEVDASMPAGIFDLPAGAPVLKPVE